jgi:REP element-mobilizing transposase RayT
MNGKRRSIRLKGYDYSQKGWYFVTIDLENKRNLFWKEDDKFELNEIGKMIEKIILEIPIYYLGILIDEFIVMPNHVHLILNINKGRKWDSDDDGKGRKWDSARTFNQNIVGADPRIRPIDINSNIRPIDINSNIRPIDINSNIRPNNNNPRIRPNNKIDSNLSLSKIIQRFKILSTNRYINGVKNRDWPRFYKRLWQRDYYERIIRNNQEYLRIKEYIKNNPKNWIKKSPRKARVKRADTEVRPYTEIC